MNIGHRDWLPVLVQSFRRKARISAGDVVSWLSYHWFYMKLIWNLNHSIIHIRAGTIGLEMNCFVLTVCKTVAPICTHINTVWHGRICIHFRSLLTCTLHIRMVAFQLVVTQQRKYVLTLHHILSIITLSIQMANGRALSKSTHYFHGLKKFNVNQWFRNIPWSHPLFFIESNLQNQWIIREVTKQ